jgi:hypothetical protein
LRVFTFIGAFVVGVIAVVAIGALYLMWKHRQWQEEMGGAYNSKASFDGVQDRQDTPDQ